MQLQELHSVKCDLCERPFVTMYSSMHVCTNCACLSDDEDLECESEEGD